MRPGKLFIVGIGPGDLKQMTFRANEAICASGVVVGYSTYIDLLGDLTKGKEIIATGMTREIERVRRAILEARNGKVVSLVSSGDSGIYGMAGLAFDLSKDENIDIEVVPGVTAAVSCAALLGAPIMHDSVIISLSDRLTEKDIILKRLGYAAKGDFVIVLYNPRSKIRTVLFEEACDMMVKFQDKKVLVGLVWNAYRDKQCTDIITLGELKENSQRIDMFTTIIIGNKTTAVKDGRMVTSRGYETKLEDSKV